MISLAGNYGRRPQPRRQNWTPTAGQLNGLSQTGISRTATGQGYSAGRQPGSARPSSPFIGAPASDVAGTKAATYAWNQANLTKTAGFLGQENSTPYRYDQYGNDLPAGWMGQGREPMGTTPMYNRSGAPVSSPNDVDKVSGSVMNMGSLSPQSAGSQPSALRAQGGTAPSAASGQPLPGQSWSGIGPPMRPADPYAPGGSYAQNPLQPGPQTAKSLPQGQLSSGGAAPTFGMRAAAYGGPAPQLSSTVGTVSGWRPPTTPPAGGGLNIPGFIPGTTAIPNAAAGQQSINPVDGLPEAVVWDDPQGRPTPPDDSGDWTWDTNQGSFVWTPNGEQVPGAGQPGSGLPGSGQPGGGQPGSGPNNPNGPVNPDFPEGDAELPPELRDQPDIGDDNPNLPGDDDDWDDPNPNGPFGPEIEQPPGGGPQGPAGGGNVGPPSGPVAPGAPGGGGGAPGGGAPGGGGAGGAPGSPGMPQPPGGTSQPYPQTFPWPGGGGGQNPQLINQLLEEYRRAHTEGRTANETRYNDLMGFLNQRLNRNLERSSGLGEADRQGIDRDYDRLSANADQDLISRGFRNSSVRQNVQRGNEEDRQYAKNRLNETLRREQTGIDLDASKDVLDAMERRTDGYPSMDQLISLAMQLGVAGQLGGAYGGGGGGITPQFLQLPGGGMVNNPQARR